MLTILDALQSIGVEVSAHRQMQIRCPFHKGGSESNPSARVYPEDNSFYCWTCHKTYTPVDVIATSGGISIPEAIARIRDQYGTSPAQRGVSVRQRLDQTLAELIYDVSSLDDSRRAHAESELDSLLQRAARGDSQLDCLDTANAMLKKWWPTLT